MKDSYRSKFANASKNVNVKWFSVVDKGSLKKRSFILKSGKAYLLIFALCFSAFTVCKAQVTEAWVRTYNGSDNGFDEAEKVAIDANGNVYVTGFSWSATTREDYTTIKYNAAGVKLWEQKYIGPGNSVDLARALVVDEIGNVYVSGQSGNGTPSFDQVTVKYNAAGVQQWVQIYNGSGNEIDSDNVSDIAVDQYGNVYVTGQSGNGNSSDYVTVKYDSAGVQQWVQTYNGPGNSEDGALAIALDGNGNIYVTGITNNSLTSSDRDFVTIKYNAAGVQQWVKIYNGTGNGDDYPTGFAVDASGNAYVTGGSSNGLNYDYATVKYDSTGLEQWIGIFNGAGNGLDFARSLAVDESGNVYVTGESKNVDILDYGTVKYNAAGVQQWVQYYDGIGNDNVDDAEDIALDGIGNVYVTGYSHDGTSGNYATVKYNAAGMQEWAQIYSTPGDVEDNANDLAIDGNGNVYVTGYSFAATIHDYTTVKYSQGLTYYLDADGDTFGNVNVSMISQTQPNGYVLNSTDCDDADATVYPGAPEMCDGVDHNCDGIILPVQTAPTIAVIPGPGPFTGGDSNTIYLGYGPQTVTLQASGGGSYSWSPIAGLSNASISNPVFTPTAAGSYQFTVTAINNYDCEASASVTITVIDARCGNKNDEVLICHNGHENCISSNAVAAHLNHGDNLGGCNSSSARLTNTQIGEKAEMNLTAMPNPFFKRTDLSFSLNNGGKYKLELLDLKGSLVQVIDEGYGVAREFYSYNLEGSYLKEGVYLLRLVSEDKVSHLRIVFQR